MLFLEELKFEPLYKPKYPVQTLEKALEIIELLAAQKSDEGLGVSDLSEELNLGKSTIHRLLDTLVAYQYVDRLENNRYRLSWRLFQIGNILPRQRTISNIDSKMLKELSDKVEETVNLGVKEHKDVIVVSKVDPEIASRVKVDFRVGEREPFHATAMGKVLFCEMERDKIEQLFGSSQLPRYTDKTVQSLDKLMVELDKVREQGFAIDDEEFSPGLSCIAMPIRDYTGKIVAATSVSGPAFRLGFNKIMTVREELYKMTQKISDQLGYGFADSYDQEG